MSSEFSPRAALCTAIVLGGFAAVATAQFSAGYFGMSGAPRDGLMPITRGTAPVANQEREILGAVLLHEARRPGRWDVCLRMSDRGRTFEREKRAVRGLEQRLKREPGARVDVAVHLARLLEPRRTWLAASDESTPAAQLAPDTVVPLHRAEQSLIVSPPTSGVEIELEGSSVPQAFRSLGPGCSTLFFSAPATAGEIAFVETRFECGAGCREEWLYAVVLRDHRWRVAAMSRL